MEGRREGIQERRKEGGKEGPVIYERRDKGNERRKEGIRKGNERKEGRKE